MDFIPPSLHAAIRSGRNRQPLQEHIQAALTSGAATVLGEPGCEYLVKQSGEKRIGNMYVPYCLSIPGGVTLNLRGATISLAGGQNAAILVNDGFGKAMDFDISIVNGHFEGNSRIQETLGAGGEMPCIMLRDVARPIVRDIVVRNARQYAGRFLKCSDGKFTNLSCLVSDGDGWSFGIHPADQWVTNSRIDDVSASECNGRYPGLVGNPVIFTVKQCSVGLVNAKACSAGIKIQDSSAQSSFRELHFSGGDNGTANSGIKVQGNVELGLNPTEITIGKVFASNCMGEGLAIRSAKDVYIDSYLGETNSRLLRDRDIDLRGSTISIGQLLSRDSQGYGLTINGKGRYAIDSVGVFEPRGRGVQITAECSIKIGRCEIVSLKSPSSFSRGLSVTAQGVSGEIAQLIVKTMEDEKVERVFVEPGNPALKIVRAAEAL